MKVLHRIFAVFRKEFIQLKRDKRTAAMAIGIPLIFLLIFGYAANFNIANLPTAVVTESHDKAAQEFKANLWADTTFEKVTLPSQTLKSLKSAIKDGKVKVGVYLPVGYGTDSSAQPVIYTDGSDLFSSQSASGKIMRVFQKSMNSQVLEARENALANIRATPLAAFIPKDLQTMTVPKPAKLVYLYNKDLKSSYVMIPALVGLVLAFILVLLTALGIVRERERGTLEQLLVTPIKPLELMIGKMLPYVAIGLFDLLLVVASGIWIFSVPFRGSIWPFAAAALAFLVCGLALGLLISSVSQNQQQAMQLAMFTVMPQIILSGFIFPISAMPVAVRSISYILPLTYFMPVSRATFLKEPGVAGLWTNVLILWGFAIVLVALASVKFRKQQV